MVPPVPEPTEVSPPAMQQRFFSSAEVPPCMMRGRIPPETQSDWSASHGSRMSQGLTEQEAQDPAQHNFFRKHCAWDLDKN
eukprot:342222-Prymnesium_polylepis.1